MKPTEYTCKEAVVLDTSGEFARVIVKRGSACDHCSQAGSCVALSGGGSLEVKQARNLAGASEGDRVELSLKSRTLVTGALVMYLLPLILMAMFIVVAFFLAPVMHLGVSQNTLVLVAAVVGLLASLPLIRLFNAWLKGASADMPSVTKVLSVQIPEKLPHTRDSQQLFVKGE